MSVLKEGKTIQSAETNLWQRWRRFSTRWAILNSPKCRTSYTLYEDMHDFHSSYSYWAYILKVGGYSFQWLKLQLVCRLNHWIIDSTAEFLQCPSVTSVLTRLNNTFLSHKIETSSNRISILCIIERDSWCSCAVFGLLLLNIEQL